MQDGASSAPSELSYEELVQMIGDKMNTALETMLKKIKLQNMGRSMQAFTGERGAEQLTFWQYVLSLEQMELKV